MIGIKIGRHEIYLGKKAGNYDRCPLDDPLPSVLVLDLS